MESSAAKRVQRDLQDITKSEKAVQCGIKVELVNDSFLELRGEIAGPPDTPYEGGKFKLDIKIPRNYPFDPPVVSFLSKIWHANICSKSGYICLDILVEQWSASLRLRTILLSIQSLLSSPEPDSPQNWEASTQFLKNPEMFELTARHWTNVYAGGPSKIQSFDDKVRKVIELGFSEHIARVYLSFHWDLQQAIVEIKRCHESSQSEESD